MAAAVAVLCVARLGVLAMTRRRQEELVRLTLSNASDLHVAQKELLDGMEVLKVMGLQRRAVDRWLARLHDGLDVATRRALLDARLASALGVISLLGALILTYGCGYLVIAGHVSLGTMLALSGVAGYFFTSVHNLVMAAYQFEGCAASIGRLRDLLASPTDVDGGAPIEPGVQWGIELERVSFSYAHLQTALTDVSLALGSGERVAIVGGSGSGKTTLARLMVGLYTPSSGRILVGGRDLRELDRASLLESCGVVAQNLFLFSGSVRSNITMDDDGIDDEAIVRAARLADIHDQIMELPQGYDTPVVSGGGSLSAGQRQRIGLARAIVRKPRMLILDEATGHLDPATERRVLERVRQLGCTQVIVTHRLETAHSCDRIYVLDQGRVVGVGTHAELARSCGLYRALLARERPSESPARVTALLSGGSMGASRQVEQL